MIDARTKFCCVIGNPVEQSLSPQLHNAVYKALGLNYVFLAFKVRQVKEALLGLKELNAAGISVTIPHKLTVLKYIDRIDDVAKRIGAVNTILNKNGKLIGTNTDWIGAIRALEENIEISNKKIALIGAGGAARALAYGFKLKGAKVSVFNRTKIHAQKIVEDFNLEGAHALNEIEIISNMEIIVNTTPVGMAPNDNLSLIPKEFITSKHIVFDIIFKPRMTKLLSDSVQKGAKIVLGERMLLYGVFEQFKLFTGISPQLEIMEKTLKEIKNA